MKKIDDLAMAGLAVSLKFLNSIAPENIGPDFAALDGIVRKAGLSSARRVRIDAMIYDGAKRQQ